VPWSGTPAQLQVPAISVRAAAMAGASPGSSPQATPAAQTSTACRSTPNTTACNIETHFIGAAR